jgi:hypothetical protein
MTQPNGTPAPALVRPAVPILTDRAVKMICVTALFIAGLHYTVLFAQIVFVLLLQRYGKVEFRAIPPDLRGDRPSLEITPPTEKL